MSGNLETVKGVIQSQVALFLQQTGRDASEGKDELDALLEKVGPQLADALASGDEMSVGLLRDQIAIETARVSLGLVYRERQIVSSIISTAIQTAIALA